MTATRYQPALVATAAGLTAVDRRQANDLLVEWGHYLGPCDRPFGSEGWVLEVAGRPVSVAVSASIVSTTAAGLDMREVVELARLCSAPDSRWATRPMLRLWREIAAPAWRYWPVRAAVAYSANGRHPGDIYRFDGWERAAANSSSGGGGTWSTSRKPGAAAAGVKSLWLWRYSEPTAGTP